MTQRIVEDARARLARHPKPSECWLLCEACWRFFQYGSARRNADFPHEECPFADCTGVEVGFHLHLWEDLREPGDPRWPTSSDELSHGLRAPDMEAFYQAQFEARAAALIAAFTASEHAAALGEAPPRYLEPFLQMMSDLCWDLTQDTGAGFRQDSASDLVFELPVWAQVADPDEIPRMLAELRGFFAFAAETDAITDAAAWRDFWAGRLPRSSALALVKVARAPGLDPGLDPALDPALDDDGPNDFFIDRFTETMEVDARLARLRRGRPRRGRRARS